MAVAEGRVAKSDCPRSIRLISAVGFRSRIRSGCLSQVMDIRVLGPLEAYADGTDVTPTSPSQRTVLAVLAAHPDRHVRADTLIDALWGSDPPPSAERTLRSYVSRLRAVVGSCIVAGRGGFCLSSSSIRLDSIEFERRVASAKLLAPQAAADALRSALDLWHGPAFGELGDLRTDICVPKSVGRANSPVHW